MSHRPLTASELAHVLEEHLRPQAEAPVRAPGVLGRRQQDFILRGVGIFVKSDSEMGCQFPSGSTKALRLMDLDGVEQWLIRAMDVFDKQGLYAGIAALSEVDPFARELEASAVSVTLDEVGGVLSAFMRGLSGRDLVPIAGARFYTDADHVFLHKSDTLFPTRQANFSFQNSWVHFSGPRGDTAPSATPVRRSVPVSICSRTVPMRWRCFMPWRRGD